MITQQEIDHMAEAAKLSDAACRWITYFMMGYLRWDASSDATQAFFEQVKLYLPKPREIPKDRDQ